MFADGKRRSGEIAKFQFLTPANWWVATFSLQKVPESAGDGGIFPFLFCCAKAGLWIKAKFRSLAIPWNEPLTTKKGGITMELYEKKKKKKKKKKKVHCTLRVYTLFIATSLSWKIYRNNFI